MGDATGPVRCPHCGGTDFFVLSTGVAYRGGTIIETYRWPAEGAAPVDSLGLEDAGYEVEQEVLEEPDIVAVEGQVRAMCVGCLTDLTEQYLTYGRGESLLPV